MRINTNVASLVAQEANVQVNKTLSESLEKLSTGLRINKAADDSSGMAIADKLRTQASSLGQGIQNANNGSALIQIADKAMGEQSNLLDIVKTKLLQASTSTTSKEGKEAIRKDISKLLQQIDNIARSTNYNGVNLLEKKGVEFNFQVGETVKDAISTTSAYSVTTAGLGAAQQISTDTEATVDYKKGVAIKVNDTALTVERDPNATTPVDSSHSGAVIINGASGGSAGDASMSVSATKVEAITFENANAADTILLTTDDIALRSELDAIAASNSDVTKNSDGQYTVAVTGGTAEILAFSGPVDISKLTISGVTTADDDDDATAVTIATDDKVTVTKINGAGVLSLESGLYTDADGTVVADEFLIGAGCNTAEGLVYPTTSSSASKGVILESGTIGAQYDPTLAVDANETVGVSITSTDSAESDETSYTVNAKDVTRMVLAETTGSVSLSSGNAATIAKLDEMAANDSELTKITSGSYVFKSDTNAGVLDFGGKFDLRDLIVSTVDKTEKITFETNKAVNVTKNLDGILKGNILLESATFTAVGVVTNEGNLIGSTSDTLVTSESLAGLKELQEYSLTQEVANKYMAIVDSALTQLNTVRSDFGSTQNQLQSSIRNMMTTKTNIKAAESSIRDVDYAAESANFNKQNIIAQAGTYAISQANQVQQNVLRLLQ